MSSTTGSMMFIADVTIQFHGRESIEVDAGRFLKADVGGYMKTAYELVSLQKTTAGAN